MVERRQRREKGARARELVRGMETTLGPSGLEAVPARGEPAPREGRDPSGCAGCKYISDK
jgi:hypothetical protein